MVTRSGMNIQSSRFSGLENIFELVKIFNGPRSHQDLLHPALTDAAWRRRKHPRNLNSLPYHTPSYPVLSHSEQDSVLSLSGPSDPCGPHPLQRSPEAQQVHMSQPETSLTSTKTSLILTSCPSVPATGRCVLVLGCVFAGVGVCVRTVIPVMGDSVCVKS